MQKATKEATFEDYAPLFKATIDAKCSHRGSILWLLSIHTAVLSKRLHLVSMTNVACAAVDHHISTLARPAVMSDFALNDIVADQALGLVDENVKVRIHLGE